MNASACGVVFESVLVDITSFMRGRSGKHWTDAYEIIKAGHVSLLKLQNVSITEATMTAAARDGRHDLVQWLYAVDSSTWTAEALHAAAANGHLHVIVAIQEFTTLGCACRATSSAARGGHLSVVKYLYATAKCIDVTSAIVSAADAEQYHVAIWLENQVEDTNKGSQSVPSQEPLPLTRWWDKLSLFKLPAITL